MGFGFETKIMMQVILHVHPGRKFSNLALLIKTLMLVKHFAESYLEIITQGKKINLKLNLYQFFCFFRSITFFLQL